MDFSDLKAADQDTAKQLEELVYETSRLGAKDGCERLMLAGTHFKGLSIAEAYRLIEPTKIQNEVEEAQAQSYWVGRLHIIRNCLALCPLILTWIALYTASSAYQQDLQKYPNDLYEPFLKLWQFGFHNTTGFTFSIAALIDVLLLFVYLLAIIAVVLAETKAQEVTQEFADSLHRTTDQLITCIGRVGATSTSDVDRIVRTIEHVATLGFNELTKTVKSLADVDADRIARALKVVIQDALDASKDVAEQAKQTLAEVNADFKDLTNQLRIDLGNLGSNLNTLSSGLISYDKQLQSLTDLSINLGVASTSLAGNTDKLTQSTQAYAAIGRDISTQINSLNSTQQKAITTFDDIKREAITQMGSFATQLDTTAQAAGQVAQYVVHVTAQDVKAMSSSVVTAADQVTEAAKALKLLQMALEKSDKHLQWTLSQTDKHLQQSLSMTDKHLESSIQQIETQLQATNTALQDAVRGLNNVTTSLKRKKPFWRRK